MEKAFKEMGELMSNTEILEKYRKMFNEEFKRLMELIGHNFSETQFVLESALDLAINDQMSDFYK